MFIDFDDHETSKAFSPSSNGAPECGYRIIMNHRMCQKDPKRTFKIFQVEAFSHSIFIQCTFLAYASAYALRSPMPSQVLFRRGGCLRLTFFLMVSLAVGPLSCGHRSFVAFGSASGFVHMFPHVSTCFHMFPHVSTCFHTSVRILGYLRQSYCVLTALHAL